jgi:SAM-dependent MidA family methyltransferase
VSLEERLRQRIQREGPITFCEWMKAALYDEREGYYCTNRVRQGRAGDYRTAPEISPLFATTFASYFAKLFDELGSPPDFTIIEVGAGTGEFAYGVLTALQAEHPQVFRATNYAIEEVGAAPRAQCAARLAEFSDRVSIRSPSVSEGKLRGMALPDGWASDTVIGIVFSNELIDAFPVNRVVMRNGRLRQLYVGVDDAQFVWVEGELEKAVADYCARVTLNVREGQIAEINLDAEIFIARAAELIKAGYVITIDYGAERNDLLNSPDRHDGTLRGFRLHQFADSVLDKPGEQDLTSTADWTQIKEAGQQVGLRAVRFEQLDQFLIAEGLLEKLGELTPASADTAEATHLTTSARELILPTGMAASFQVLVQRKTPFKH